MAFGGAHVAGELPMYTKGYVLEIKMIEVELLLCLGII